MKKIMSGNEAIARGAYEAGCTVASAYPGTPSTEILENLSLYKEVYSEWAPNEKVACEVACGAAIAGARAMTTMKHVGLNVAADPMFTIAYEGVNGGLLIVSADDPGMHSSQNEQDNRLYAAHARLALVEPSDSQECKDYVKYAYELSERFDTAVLFRTTTRVSHSKGLVELAERVDVGVKPYQKNTDKYIMVPANSRRKHPEVEARLLSIQEYANDCPMNRFEWNSLELGIITSGISYQYAKEIYGDSVSYLKLGLTYPLPDKMIREFGQKVKSIIVIEENEPFLENAIKLLGIPCKGKDIIPVCGELNPDILRKVLLKEPEHESVKLDMHIPARPPVLCPGCPHRGIFYAVSKYKDVIATSDIGCYTLGMVEPLNVADTVIDMGAGFSAAVGFQKASMMCSRDDKIFGFMGDSTFFHSGMTALLEIVYNNSPVVSVILDNSITAMTGHQENPGTGHTLMGEIANVIDIVQVVKALGIKEKNIRVVDPYNLAETNDAVKEAYVSLEPFVIITRRPCALIKDVLRKRAHMYSFIHEDKCKRCKMCIKTGCPAISYRNHTMSIDRSMCNGCGLCKQVCKFGAIEKVGE